MEKGILPFVTGMACAQLVVLNLGILSGAQSTGRASNAGFNPVSVTLSFWDPGFLFKIKKRLD